MADGFRGLRLHDTLAREKRDFRPLDWAEGSAVAEADRRVRMYVCGPTVYDFAHIGNARPVIVFDVLYRLLRHLYGSEHVTYVRNVTDVDDKINARAERDFPGLPLNEAIARVTALTEAQFHEDVAALGCLPPSVEPRATQHIEEMKRLIERLVAGGHAYVAECHVLFDVGSMPDYGKLSRRSTDDLIAGARVDVAPYKKGPMDFVLWKPSKPGEPSWESPAGIAERGRPGWHIECSAMSRVHLGDVFDIHGGGIDLVFPHHENEIAQSRCALGTPAMANYWLHNGFLMVEGEKMSKSLGNFTTIRDVLKDWPGDVVRLNMLKTHYRQPIDWTEAGLRVSAAEVDDWTTSAGWHSKPRDTRAEPTAELAGILADDLNTPQAIAYLHDLAKHAGTNSDDSQTFVNNLAFLGIFRDYDHEIEPLFSAASKTLDADNNPVIINWLNRAEWLRRKTFDIEAIRRFLDRHEEYQRYLAADASWAKAAQIADIGYLNDLIVGRQAAKKARNFAEADRLRDELAAMGIALKDGKDPATGEPVTTWEVAR